jgi:hypothetical protein
VIVLVGCAKKQSDDGMSEQAKQMTASSPATGKADASSASSGGGGGMAEARSAAGGSPEAPKDAPGNPAKLGTMAQSRPDRYLIKNAIVTVEAEDVRKSTDKLLLYVRMAQGYVSNLQETVDGLGARAVTMQVRVPATGFDASMQQLASLGKVLDKQVTAEDVTEEFVDTASTLRNLKRTEDRLLEHLSRTGKLSDTLLIEKELTRVREEIEQREGRLRFLSHRIDYCTIAVTLKEKAKAQGVVPPESFSTGKEATDATRSLVGFLRDVWSVVIWVGIWSVVWLPMLVIGLVFIRAIRLKNKRPPAPGPA